jgi:hypothetical protein
MSAEGPRPNLPEPALSREIVSALVAAAKRTGRDVFNDRDGFVIQTSKTTQVKLDVVNGACHISFTNSLGPSAMSIRAENLSQLEESLRRILGTEPPARTVPQ